MSPEPPLSRPPQEHSSLEGDPLLRVARARLRELRAPESLRARISAMLAVEERLGP